MKRLKEILRVQAERATGARGAIVTVVGGYIIYLGLKLPANTASGASTMSMPVSIGFMVVMLLLGVLTVLYGGFLFIAGWNRSKAGQSGDTPGEDGPGGEHGEDHHDDSQKGDKIL